jgi:anti-sigma regulatory factor (Ser/Thr protein kinase)
MGLEKLEELKANIELPLFEGNNWSLPTNIDLIEPAKEALGKKLGEADWDEDSDDVYYLQLVFSEALINAIAHGNLGIVKPDNSQETITELAKAEQAVHPTDKKVCVTIGADKNRISIKIRDEGNGFNWREVQDPTLPESLLKKKGRGLLFMNKFCDSVTHNNKGNEVTIVKEKKK